MLKMKNGNTRILQVGDLIYENDTVYGDNKKLHHQKRNSSFRK